MTNLITLFNVYLNTFNSRKKTKNKFKQYFHTHTHNQFEVDNQLIFIGNSNHIQSASSKTARNQQDEQASIQTRGNNRFYR